MLIRRVIVEFEITNPEHQKRLVAQRSANPLDASLEKCYVVSPRVVRLPSVERPRQ
jgi:hypothetical protein